MFWTIVGAIIFILFLPILFYFVIALFATALSPILLFDYILRKIFPSYRRSHEAHEKEKREKELQNLPEFLPKTNHSDF